MRTLHLICNAHLDPVWQWEWEEGAAEAISTFRVAADFCEANDAFIFNHNEVILYKWVEEYAPELFARIQRLVKNGKWHIMGGWYLQPDCNMPSGESFARQILVGRNYFREKFGAEPKTAINFDPFGHTRGLAQILARSGYDSYLFCRPDNNDCPLPSDDFEWVGYDGSKIIGHRSSEFYCSQGGHAREKVKGWMDRNRDRKVGLVLWGVGDHGGGPSRVDLNDLDSLARETGDWRIIHSTPEAYFNELREKEIPLPRHEGDINAWAVGCYTSQVRLKQKHRELENEIYALEKMMSHAAISGLADYPAGEIHEALCDLLFAEFHDILPGSSVQPVEDMALRLMDHGLEIVSRLKARAFFALASGQKTAVEGEIPILVYNPHPRRISGVFECEFMLAGQNWNDVFTMPHVYQDGRRLPCQVEKEYGNLNLDWRKRVVFSATLEPSRMNRFDCRVEVLPARPKTQLEPVDGKLRFKTDDLEVVINCETGLMDCYKAGGTDYLKAGAFAPTILEDSADPWEMAVQRFDKVAGTFKAMTPERAARFAGVSAQALPPVRVIEDGEVRTVIESLMEWGDSFICQTYKLPRRGTEIEVNVRVFWNEKNRMLKLRVPTVFTDGGYMGQVAYGADSLPTGGKEVVAQKWVAAVSRSKDHAFSCVNEGSYGSDFRDGEMRLTLMRSAAYAGHPIGNRPIVRQDRFTTRIDQGERFFRFWLKGSPFNERMAAIDSEALAHNEEPMALSYFPSGLGTAPKPLAILSDPTVQLTAFKKAENSGEFVIRLFEPTGAARETTLELPALGTSAKASLGGFEIKTLLVDPKTGRIRETNLIER
ncbi:MAG TPA: glycoside hydrolase family 38 C-terminal domain-containing protein [Candidatus Brocadiia bacterium]|nr:glycoside hydrolase family 38 C-terminal domain-containing protein [Candidatus Brocadiia bacterium]